MAHFPPEIFNEIFSVATPDTVRTCRLLNRHLSQLATSHAFRHVRIEAAGEVSKFVNISQAPHLRCHTRELSISTLVGPPFEYHVNNTCKFPLDFFLALPNLRLFSGLTRLHLGFNEYCGNNEARTFLDVEENNDFRYYVLWTVFACLTGEWTAESSSDLYEDLDFNIYEEDNHEESEDDEGSEGMVSPETLLERLTLEAVDARTDVITLEALAIQNLAGYDDTRLTSSDLFRKVLSTITDLKLHVVFEKEDECPEDEIYLPERFAFMESLHKTWLAPKVAQNLRVLSLFCDDYWGWTPKMDFREINPGIGPHSGFPNLEVLALGNYIFSHDWQIDWIPSLGRQNRYGGLRELYLDDCPILYYFHLYTDLDKSTGYPVTKSFLGSHNEPLGTQLKQESHLRWDHILSSWKKNMNALKVFRSGSGDWQSHNSDLIGSAYEQLGLGWTDRHDNRFNRANFITYDCPPPRDREEISDFRRWFRGVGIGSDETTPPLQYIEFHHGTGPSPWLGGTDAEHGFFEHPHESDLQALEHLLKTIKSHT
ncbi:hypothetical protein M426DRAFT_325886 [Hypoxylon sp. CI-4A]|nr:hypothetical protein M426DRAFT_325886 [Hypoxylon sp. CI-4A]